MMQTWVVRVCVQHNQPFWMGDFRADGRAEAKREARLFVSAHLPLDTLILGIAPGTAVVTFHGPEIPINEPCCGP